ncbi:MAG TPA: hydrogenase maturation protease, partial [Streptosporangiaceae bacterium]
MTEPGAPAHGPRSQAAALRAAVIGIGNLYRRDDGIGPALVAALKRLRPPGVSLTVADGEPSQLLDAWSGAPLAIVVDAVLCEAPAPGRIHRTVIHRTGRGSGADDLMVPAPGSRAAASTHGLGIPDAVRLAEALHQAPARLVVIADKYDVSSNDMLMWWEQDSLTRLALLYVESFGSPRKFARTARRVGLRMPVLTVVGGRSEAGQSAAASHTAAAATPLVTREALFGQAGIIAASSLGELIEAAALLACQPLPAGNRVAIITNAGGAGVLAADACSDEGLEVVKLSGATRRRLRGLLPAAAEVAGPVDTTAAVSADTFRACLEQVAADDGVDAVIAARQSIPSASPGGRCRDTARTASPCPARYAARTRPTCPVPNTTCSRS